MSECQYYEFQTIDRQLSDRQMRELRTISSRATISRTRFSSYYTYGDLKANPCDLLVQYFDASLSFAHWFYVELAFRFPKTTVDMRGLRRYAAGQSLDVHSRVPTGGQGGHRLIENFSSSSLSDASQASESLGLSIPKLHQRFETLQCATPART